MSCVAQAVMGKGVRGLADFVPGGSYLFDVIGDAYKLLRERRKAAELRAEVSEISLDNFIVRPQRRYVEKYSASAAWGKVDADARHELIEHVAGLPSSVVDDDIAAKVRRGRVHGMAE